MMLIGFTSKPLWTFILLYLPLVFWTPCEGLNIDPSQPVISAAGLHVVLPCRLDPPIDVQEFTVEWSKLKPGDPQSWTTVYLYRDGKEEARETIRPYVGRTRMFLDQLEHGNMSLRILNVTSADAGRYRCKCFIQGEEEDADVQLVVGQTKHHDWILPVVFGFSFVLTVGLVIGFFIRRHRQNKTNTKPKE